MKLTLAAECPYTTFCSLAAVELTKSRHLVQFSTSSVFSDVDVEGRGLVSFDLANLESKLIVIDLKTGKQ